ncbi:MAG: NAD(P)/FAD-dependent oxidoreductase [Isosphaeraceae bacterium]|nr:NAD(P)/FAD-dependent oxidoreductase [Isosphaeraceae bacterium]
MTELTPRVVIVGAGFGGLNAAQALRRARVRVTVIDRQNHHLFQPLLYQVATAALNPSDIASPVRRILRHQANAEVLLAEVSAIDLARQRVVLDDGAMAYDFLIVATGATHSYFGHDDWAQFAPGLKSIPDALEIRRRVLFAFEAAEREPDPARRRSWLTFVVVGGGPTGVELAGALSEIARHALAKDFRHIDPTQAHVILLEGTNHILPAFVAPLPEKGRRQLERLGVDVRTGQIVTAIDAAGVAIGPDRIEARTVLWAAGVAASPLARTLGVELDRAGRVRVEPDLTVPGHPEVAVIGDLAHFDQDGALVPGVAPAAIQEARHAARNVVRSLRGQPRLPFRYRDKGSLATIGRAAGIAQIGRVRLSGLVAWLAWLFIHILFLIGFRNRVFVLFSWAWSYVTYDRGARLITGPPHRDENAIGKTPG